MDSLTGRFEGEIRLGTDTYARATAMDPFFRSAGAQSKRYDFSQLNAPSVFPNLGAQGMVRQASLFDLLSDIGQANQSISPTLMAISPLFDNVMPYGRATPTEVWSCLWRNPTTEVDGNWPCLGLGS